MKSFGDILKRRIFPLILIVVGLVLAIVAVQVLRGVPGFVSFFIGAAALITGILIIIY
ncbi:MAG: hypothetical protein PHG35_04400 [Dehalococcoidales bacterium]|nr:hypothetical protein [Dehalococcoidales bacterium]